ncbi:MAG: MFS transporter [Chthoniobacteraceae bacterium]
MKLSFAEKVGYGLGDTASNFVWGTMMSFLMYYYTDIFGITAAAVGTLFLFARAGDGAVDFIMGAIADRTRTRWGKFRPYLLWMCLPLAFSFFITFTTPPFTMNGKIIYAWVTYNLLMIFYTAINIPYSALSGVMTDDPLDRTSLNSYRMALAQIGALIVNASTLPLIAYFGHGNAAHGYQITVALFCVAAVALFLVTFLTTRERISPPPSQKTKIKDDLMTLFGNRHWVVMFVTGITNLTFVIARCSAGMYYFKYCMKMSDSQISSYLVFGSLSFIVGACLTRWVVKALGKKNAFIVTMAGAGLTAIPLFWIAPGQLPLLYLCQFLGSVVGGMNATLYWAMIADTADFSEWKFHTRTTGIVFSATTCSQKVGMGIGGAFAGMLLSHFGYVANVAQTSSALYGILLLSSLIPAAGSLFLAAFFSFYGLTEDFCSKMRAELNQRREQRQAITS